MTSNDNSTREKLKMFAASPASSQDFESNFRADDVPMKYNDSIQANKIINRPTSTQANEVVNGISRIDKLTNSTHGKSSLSYFHSSQSPIKNAESINTNNTNSFLLDVSSTTKTKDNNADISNPFMDAQCNMASTPTIFKEQLPVEKVIELDNFSSERTLTTSKLFNTQNYQPPKVIQLTREKLSDADDVIEMVTGVTPNTDDFGVDRSDRQSRNRQFPGPAGILPRLHEGLESNPRLANLMRLHKGSELKQYIVGGEQSNSAHRSPPGHVGSKENG